MATTKRITRADSNGSVATHHPELGDHIETSVETITPDLARQYLANMKNPRHLNQATVKCYARDMAHGKWDLGAGSIKFDSEGRCRDGQHTLTACVESDVTIVMVVFRGVSEGAVRNMDQGKKRAWADRLRDEGVPNAQFVQSAVVLGWRWDHDLFRGGSQSHKVSQYDMESWRDANPAIDDAVQAAKPLRRIGANVTMMSAFIHRAGIISPGAIPDFVHGLTTGDVPSDSPIRKLRDKTMMQTSLPNKSVGLSQIVNLAIATKAWNAWVTGRTIQQLSWRRGPTLKESFPDLVGEDGKPWPFPDVIERARRTL